MTAATAAIPRSARGRITETRYYGQTAGTTSRTPGRRPTGPVAQRPVHSHDVRVGPEDLCLDELFEPKPQQAAPPPDRRGSDHRSRKSRRCPGPESSLLILFGLLLVIPGSAACP